MPLIPPKNGSKKPWRCRRCPGWTGNNGKVCSRCLFGLPPKDETPRRIFKEPVFELVVKE
jgi:hypothetical protein